jgi:hypothetical protein|uniref:Uncharacterized protein n=2 Tax=unclassified Caudoviricetes TaxID=2788787 RepID=A0A8S5MA48_9CAUD|nr:MAG TPA: hypothetical protein [Siphoviridae sp. ctsDY37]DAF96038.1 MAG TPA: hypothetical protein [Siphoviridae sp. cteLB10]
MMPSTYINLDEYEKAFIIAAIQIKVENEKKENDKIRRHRKK